MPTSSRRCGEVGDLAFGTVLKYLTPVKRFQFHSSSFIHCFWRAIFGSGSSSGDHRSTALGDAPRDAQSLPPSPELKRFVFHRAIHFIPSCLCIKRRCSVSVSGGVRRRDRRPDADHALQIASLALDNGLLSVRNRRLSASLTSINVSHGDTASARCRSLLDGCLTLLSENPYQNVFGYLEQE